MNNGTRPTMTCLTEADAKRFYRLAQQRLRAGRVYNVCALQNGLGIPVLQLLDAVAAGEIPRSLGEGLNLCVQGNDLVDWLRERARMPREPS
jgi:hypothetical protein